jgi:hypothetical protein
LFSVVLFILCIYFILVCCCDGSMMIYSIWFDRYILSLKQWFKCVKKKWFKRTFIQETLVNLWGLDFYQQKLFSIGFDRLCPSNPLYGLRDGLDIYPLEWLMNELIL